MCGLGYMDRGGGRLRIRASEINRKVSEDGYFGNRLRYHASCQSVSHYQLKHYSGQPEDQFPVSTYLLTYFAFGSAISAIWLDLHFSSRLSIFFVNI